VVLRVRVGIDGRPKAVEIAGSSGHPRLDEAALRAVREARFRPYLEDGRPREALVPNVEIRFQQAAE
jgi:protein TonB